MARDVTEAEFQREVIERSSELPVVVDFWAEWCGPCRTLSPVIEREAERRRGSVDLVKVDVDANQGLAMRYGIQGIPAVKAFADGQVTAEFVGAQPPAAVAAFFDRVAPSEADRLAEAEDEDSLRRALELKPGHPEAARSLGRLLLRRGENEEAEGLLKGVKGDFVADGLLARIEVARDGASAPPEALDAATRGFEAWDGDSPEVALEALQGALERVDDPEWRDRIRRVMVAIFTELGPDDPLAREHRRRLAATLH